MFLALLILLGVPSAAASEFKVMVIDTGIDGNHPMLKDYVVSDGSNHYKDSHGHGTHVAGIVAFGNHMLKGGKLEPDRLCKEVKIYSCKYYDKDATGEANLSGTIDCINKATKMGIDYINYSGGGVLGSEDEYKAIKKFSDSGGVFVTVTGNESINLERFKYFPASYKFGWKKNPPITNMLIVEALESEGRRFRVSNYHPEALQEMGKNIFSTLPNGQYGYMSGTSQAAPAVLHTILRRKCQQKLHLLQATK